MPLCEVQKVHPFWIVARCNVPPSSVCQRELVPFAAERPWSSSVEMYWSLATAMSLAPCKSSLRRCSASIVSRTCARRQSSSSSCRRVLVAVFATVVVTLYGGGVAATGVNGTYLLR